MKELPVTHQRWNNRIVRYGEEAPDQLLANPLNFRMHPKHQQDALAGVLAEVGIVQNVIVNERSGHVIDGHLRISLAMRDGQPTIPVTYVDLAPHEEAEILATLDPISALATTDAEKLRDLLDEVSTGDAAVMQMLAELAEREGVTVADSQFDTSPQLGDLEYRIVIDCASETQQAQLLERFETEGIPCRALIS